MKILQIIIPIIILFSINLQINAQELTMFQGFFGYQYYQDDVEISREEINSLMQQHDLTKTFWNKSKLHRTYAFVAIGTQITTAYLALRSINKNPFISPTTRDKLLLVTSLGSGIAAIGFTFSAASLSKKSILGYNKLISKEDFIYHIGQTNNGIGIVCSF